MRRSALVNTLRRRFGDRLPTTLTGIRAPMLKITITETPSERRIALSGKLIGPSIQELRRVGSNVVPRPREGGLSATSTM